MARAASSARRSALLESSTPCALHLQMKSVHSVNLQAAATSRWKIAQSKMSKQARSLHMSALAAAGASVAAGSSAAAEPPALPVLPAEADTDAVDALTVALEPAAAL